MRGGTVAAAASLLVVVGVGAAPLGMASGADDTTPYTVECAQGAQNASQCQVDKGTFIGWRTFHGFCHQCHSQDAIGSTFAPSLLERMKEIDHERFAHSVAEGYTGQVGVMPAWKDNPNVSKRYEELYAYLRARAEGALPPGRPDRLPD